MNSLREDAAYILHNALTAVSPTQAVKRALEQFPPCKGKLILVAVGKAAWTMAEAAWETLGTAIDRGIVITKTDHSRGPIGSLTICEAGHPVSDERSYAATEAALELVKNLSEEDLVLFLVSGGGSALFELPRIPRADWEVLNRELLASGADIVAMNTLRKRFSGVKGGRFGKLCEPARVFSVVLSDIIGDPLDMIASGPAYPDSSTPEAARSIARQYRITLTEAMEKCMEEPPITELPHVTTLVTGSVTELCKAGEAACRELGYRPLTLTSSLTCIASEAGAFLAAIAREYQSSTESLAFLAGGETVVRITGKGLGGRNQELALSAARGIAGLPNTAVFSFGSDGTDGPTDAAGGFVDGDTLRKLTEAGLSPEQILSSNDSYHGLQAVSGLLITGPTGTNVNDLAVLLIRR